MRLMRMAAAGRLPTSQLVTHTFPLDRVEEAYDVFARASDTGALTDTCRGRDDGGGAPSG